MKNTLFFLMLWSIMLTNLHAQKYSRIFPEGTKSSIYLKPGNIINPQANQSAFNDGYFILAPYGTPVLAIEDGKINSVSKNYLISADLSNSISFTKFPENLQANNPWVKQENVIGSISIQLKDGSKIHYRGLISDRIKLITGTPVRKGDTIGYVGNFRVISKDPCIQISKDNKLGKVSDIGMQLFGEKSHFEKPSKPTKTQFSPAELKEAFRIFRTSLEEGHPALYDKISKQKLDSIFQSADNSLSKPMTDIEFGEIIVPIIAKIGCSHTALSFLNGITLSRFFPLKLSYVENRCMVLADLSAQKALKRGDEILQIDGKPIADIVKEMKRYMFNDVQTDEWKNELLVLPNWFNRFFLFATNLNVKPSYKITFRDNHNNIKEITVVSSTRPTSKPLKLEKDQQISFSFNRINKETYFLSVQSCDFDDRTKNRIRAVMDSILTEHPRNLIVDLRYNEGGNDIAFLTKKLCPQRFNPECTSMVKSNSTYNLLKYDTNYDKETILFPDYVAINDQPNYWKIPAKTTDSTEIADAYKGSLYVLTGPRTQSYGTVLASFLYHAGATIVGEETGGSYYSLNAKPFAFVKLGELNLSLRLPLMKFFFNEKQDERIPANRGLIPHFKISKSLQSVLNDTDNQLDYCLQVIENKATNKQH